MKKRALVIGSQTGGLQGVLRDSARMADALDRLGFTVESCVGPQATRDGILASYECLIAQSASEDACLVYYAGHGALAVSPTYRPDQPISQASARYFQCIIPADYELSTPDDFRGISSFELSVLLARLTEKTRNVAVILDCCHSARMSRDFRLTPRALPHPLRVGVEALIERLKTQGVDPSRLDPESNPHAVRLAAAGMSQSAFEYVNDAGKTVGLMTESLLMALEESAGAPVSWRTVAERVRERVLSIAPHQRPEVEGPARRVLFGLEEPDASGVLTVKQASGEVLLGGGRIVGVHAGDEYALLPMTASARGLEEEIARVTVVEVHEAESRVSVSFREGQTMLPPGCRAVPVRSAAPRKPVVIHAEEAERAALAKAIEASSLLLVSQGPSDGPALAVVHAVEGRFELRDSTGLLLVPPAPVSDAARATLVKNLSTLAVVQRLRELEGPGIADIDPSSIEIELGRVENSQPMPLPSMDAVVTKGASLYVRIRNHSGKKVYVTVFDIGLSGKITRLSLSWASGIELRAGQEEILGRRQDGTLKGMPLSWPRGLPEDDARTEELVFIVTDKPADLSVLENPGLNTTRSGNALRSLERQLQQLHGGLRDLLVEEEEQGAFLVKRVDFLVSPWPTEAASGEFLIDERPSATLRVTAARQAARQPRRVAIRLTELVVHKNRALFGADIRVDALVVTSLPPGSKEPYRAETLRFSNVKDGDRLPLDNLLLYHGDVHDFVDIALWVSRDDTGSDSLAELLKGQLNSAEFQAAAGTLLAVTAAAPQAAMVVAATGAAATLTQIAYRLLTNAVGKSIGLYRTSLLSAEGFGVGRHPPSGLLRAQDFSFGYEVVELG